VAALGGAVGGSMVGRQLWERLWLGDGSVLQISGEERAENDLEMAAVDHLTEFRLEYGLPVWRYEIKGVVLETRMVLLHMQNTIHVAYRLASGSGPVRLELRPSLHFRAHNVPVSAPLQEPYEITAAGERYEISASGDLPSLRLLLCAAKGAFTLDGGTVRKLFFRTEARRGYEAYGALWSPGYFSAELSPGQDATVIA